MLSYIVSTPSSASNAAKDAASAAARCDTHAQELELIWMRCWKRTWEVDGEGEECEILAGDDVWE